MNPARPGRRRRSRGFRRAIPAALACVALVAAAVGVGVAQRPSSRFDPPVASRPLATALEAELRRSGAPDGVAAFYRARGYRPLWVKATGLGPLWLHGAPVAEARLMAATAAEALPSRYAGLPAAVEAARGQDPAALAKVETELSRALADYAAGISQTASARLAFVDPDWATALSDREILEQAARSTSLAAHIGGLKQVNPLYASLRQGLTSYRATWARLPGTHVPEGPTLRTGDRGERVRLLRARLGAAEGGAADRFDVELAQAVRRFQTAHGLQPTGALDGATVTALNRGPAYYERLIVANLERARALPPLTANRFIVVNVAAGRLWFYDGGKLQGSMRVVVGTPHDQTPMMAGLLRYLVVNPYWNVPVDLVRESLAPKVLRTGAKVLAEERMQILSDWSDDAYEIDPSQVDWRAVASGAVDLRVRQRPGGDNMMGAVKFMLPNELGIYLHDTPNKAAFEAPERLMSAGCIRLEDAHQLAAWLAGSSRLRAASNGMDQRVDLAEPIPVYITYLTAAPGSSGVEFHPDVYRRDPTLLASLESEGARAGLRGAVAHVEAAGAERPAGQDRS